MHQSDVNLVCLLLTVTIYLSVWNTSLLSIVLVSINLVSNVAIVLSIMKKCYKILTDLFYLLG